MRPIERIDNFIRKVDWEKLCEKWDIDPKRNFLNKKYLSYWKNNPDQRIGQVLINLGLIDDSMERWCSEEHDLLIEQGIPPEDCIYWTSIYDKDSNVLDEPLTRLINTLSKDHVKNILDFMKEHNGRVSANTAIAFQNVLNKEEQTFDENSEVPEPMQMAA